MSTNLKVTLIGTALAIVLSSCAKTADDPALPTDNPSAEAQQPKTLDEQFSQLAKKVPGFGGMFYDSSGSLSVYVTDFGTNLSAQAVQAQRAELKEALTSVFGSDVLSRGASSRLLNSQNLPSQELKILKGNYDFLDLATWRASLNNTIRGAGVVYTDIDEASNRLRIGIGSAAAIASVKQKLAEQGIPSEAVIIEETKPVQLAKALGGRFRPTVGGVRIGSGTNSTVFQSCTLGFNAFRSTVRGFITNSHCTNTPGGNESTVFYQPNISATRNNRIGVESRDPLYFTGGPCPSGERCRYSDTAFVRYNSDVNSSLGKIARVTGSGATGGSAGSRTINDASPTFTITGEVSFPFMGMELDKIGNSTGHTYGNVTMTCADVFAPDDWVNPFTTFLCQDFVSASAVASGDSGSPVFEWSGSGFIKLAGILWGAGSDSHGNNGFWFSSMSDIRRSSEMGSLTTR